MSDDFDLDLAVTSILGDQKDVKMLLRVLAKQLSEPLGGRLQVENHGGLFKKSEDIKSLSVTVGRDEFAANGHGRGVECTIGHSSGGIRIRNEKVEIAEWVRRLLAALQEEAVHSQEARLALEKIVIGGME